MNETIQTIKARRSYRAYKKTQLPADVVDEILSCGIHAPSAMNMQNWHFTVIQNQELLNWMNQQTKALLPQDWIDRMTDRNGGNADFSVFYGAPTVIVVSAVKDDRYSLINCSLATQNICLAAESLSIGSCIIGMVAPLFDAPNSVAYCKELGIPDGYHPAYAVCLGEKGMEMSNPDRRNNTINVIA